MAGPVAVPRRPQSQGVQVTPDGRIIEPVNAGLVGEELVAQAVTQNALMPNAEATRIAGGVPISDDLNEQLKLKILAAIKKTSTPEAS